MEGFQQDPKKGKKHMDLWLGSSRHRGCYLREIASKQMGSTSPRGSAARTRQLGLPNPSRGAASTGSDVQPRLSQRLVHGCAQTLGDVSAQLGRVGHGDLCPVFLRGFATAAQH